MSNIKKPDLIDIFKDEYHITELSLEESTEMMRLRNKNIEVENQRATDKKIFDKYYDAWYENTSLYSSQKKIFEDENFLAIVNMGKRAVPFIYEKIKNGFNLIVRALGPIYGENKIKINSYIGQKRTCELWCEIIEKEGDV